MTCNETPPRPAVYRLFIKHCYERGSAGKEHEAPEDDVMYTLSSPPVVPRIGETYEHVIDADYPAEDVIVPWTVMYVEHTIRPQLGFVVFETHILLGRNAELVSRTARENAARSAP